MPGFGVSIALISVDGTPQIGVVFDPVKNILYHAINNQGAYKNESSWTMPCGTSDNPLNFYYNRSITKQPYYPHILKELKAIALQIEAEELIINPPYGAVINACQALDSIPSCYFGFPKQKEGGGSLWDYAAVACIYKEIGASVSDIFGNPLDLNQKESTYMNKNGFLFSSNSKLSELIQNMYNKQQHK
jgi:3'(2'), 5'-bisphosphate nucleotidase/myo-inositol-1(or 4)-monophosphatase